MHDNVIIYIHPLNFLVYITAIDVNDTLTMGDFIELRKHRSQPLCCACRDNDG